MARWPDWIRPGDHSALEPDEIRRRRREAVLIAVTAVLVAIFVVLETRLPRLSDGGPGNVTFFLLINLNLILLVLLIFLVARNFAKLVLERRRRILGSRLRTRLVLAFVSLTIVPTALLFMVARGFLTAVIENWFSGRVDRSMQASRQIAEAYYQEGGNRSLEIAQRLADRISRNGFLAAESAARLREWLEESRAELRVDSIEVLVGQTRVASASSERLAAPLPPPGEDLDGLIGAGESLRTVSFGGGDLIRAAAAFPGQIQGAVVVSSLVPRVLSEAALQAVRTHEEYRSLRILEQPIKNGYTISFLLITLVVIFSATWFGFYLAKGITVPIQHLGEGMREVAQGNWGYRATVTGDEEISTLVHSFNAMTAELETIHSALEERHRYIGSILANITAGVVSIDPHGTVATVNPAARAMLGLAIEQTQGSHWRDVFDPARHAHVREVIAQIEQGGDEKIERQIALTGGVRSLTVWMTATTLTGENGAAQGFILFFEDVTHLLRVERMEAWREVARRIAHEIKNPLTPIQLSAQRLRKRYGALLGPDERGLLDECTRTIVGQVDALKRLVNEFSTFARMPTVEVAPHDLRSIVEEVVVLFRGAHRAIVFELSSSPDLPLVEIDREAIKRAVINLLDNAVGACEDPERGEARIQLRTTYEPQAGVVRLEVADNGCGMTPDVKVRAFEPYFSTKRDGTGLGLAIVSAIVADHQAYVRVYDNVPRGTRIVIEFPVRRSESLHTAERA